MSVVDQNPEERHYKAFISYRHKPLDMEIAKKLHKRIERFAVPKELQKNGEKKLGLVFRDQEELPISDDLTRNICNALDHSEYLIVICSPDTPGSIWVQREITYFLSHHGRERLLAFLVDGTPEESFPSQLTEVRDEKGELVRLVEPLAANICADTDIQRNRLFQTESMRILAALIGCPYDALYQREQRWKMRRMLIASLSVALVSAAFAGVVLNRNAKIREQLNLTKINESKTLAALSENAFRTGDYRGALNYALDALPGRDPGRPYVSEAERVLADELYLYNQGKDAMRYLQSFEIDADIECMILSQDGSLLAVCDEIGNLKVFETKTGTVQWGIRHKTEFGIRKLFFTKQNELLALAIDNNVLYDSTGNALWSSESLYIDSVSEEAGLFLCQEEGEDGDYYSVRDLGTMKTAGSAGHISYDNEPVISAVSPDGKYAAVLEMDSLINKTYVYVIDVNTGEEILVKEGPLRDMLSKQYTMCFSNANELIVVCSGQENILEEGSKDSGSYVQLFDGRDQWKERFSVSLDHGSQIRTTTGYYLIEEYPDHVLCGTTGIAVCSGSRLSMIDRRTGQTLWKKDLPGQAVHLTMYDNDVLGLVLNNGVITICANGYLGYDNNVGSFKCEYDTGFASSAGSDYYSSVFAAVSRDSANRTVLIGFNKDPNLEKIPYTNVIPDGTRLFYSPSRRTVGAVMYHSENDTYDLMTWNLYDGSKPNVMTVDLISYSLDAMDRVSVTEDGKIIADGRVFDLKAQTYTGLTRSGEEPEEETDTSCADPNGKVLTYAIDQEIEQEHRKYSLLCFEDGVLTHTIDIPREPEEDDIWTSKCVTAGTNGYVLVSVTDDYEEIYNYSLYAKEKNEWLDVPFMDPGEEEPVCLADEHDWAAVMKTDDTLAVYDIHSGEQKRVMESTMPFSTVAKMLFADHDRKLLVFTTTGTISIYNTEDGKQLHSSSFTNVNLRFSVGARYDVQIVPEQNRMIVIFDSSNYTSPCAIVFDKQTLEQTDFFNNFSGYLPESKKAVITSWTGPVSFAPLYTLEDMEQMAENILGN